MTFAYGQTTGGLEAQASPGLPMAELPAGVGEQMPVSREELVRAAMHDSLTGLANRQMFRERVSGALAPEQGAKMAVMLIDLDRFKAVNDTLGHPVGDELLRKVGERLRTLTREQDVLARLGGDEFAMCVVGEVEELRRRAGQIVDLLGRPFLIEGQQINVGASVGIAVAPSHGTNCEALTKSADLAMYSVKEEGRNGFRFFDPAMEERAQARRAMELALRRAVMLRQFELHYLPRVDAETQALLGMEALLRWNHPERGLLLASEFTELAEEIGMAQAIGRWMLKAACKAAAGWAGGAHVAVALRGVQFDDKTLVEGVKQALETTGLRPQRLQLEITEAVLLRNEAHVLRTLHELKALGVHIGMKDFGTGYASLSRLVSFPFDLIRVDPSIAGSAVLEPTRRAMVSAVAALGASLGVHTMLEGMLDREQLARVQGEIGSSVGGYLLSEPVGPAQLAVMLDAYFGRAITN